MTFVLRQLTQQCACAAALLFFACSPAATSQPAAATPTVTAKPSSSAAPVLDSYETLPPEQRQRPPEASAPPPWSFPPLVDSQLENGLSVKLMQRRTLPLARITLVVRAGQATSPKQPGLAVLAGEMLKVGGTGTLTSSALLDKIESLGSSLEVVTSRESTTFSLSVTSDRFDDALELLGQVIQKPRFMSTEFTKLKQRERDRVSSAARTSAGWVANMVLYKALFSNAKGEHPYSVYDATDAQLASLRLSDVKRWVKDNITPNNSVLVVAGDVSPEQVQASAAKAFASWHRGKAAAVMAIPTTEPDTADVYLVDRPKSSQAEVRVATLGPDGKSVDYPRLRVMNQVLGGGVSGRLFADVREKRSLAYSTYSVVERVAEGPSPIVLQAGTQTAKAGLAVAALLEHADKIATAAPSADETGLAARYLSDLFLLRMESVGAMADMVAQLAIFQLPNDYYDLYRQALATTTAEDAGRVANGAFASHKFVIVVAGDAERLAAPLTHFGKVKVINPDKGFGTVRELPADPAAPIELPRMDGT
ncbi:MAG TPA: pitrilysin family protein [Polyangiaceae bacterium]|jgi:predicted Zn-dependent peptidase|nr:pitrilysin family protein [Polyangiaceae bacterium]